MAAAMIVSGLSLLWLLIGVVFLALAALGFPGWRRFSFLAVGLFFFALSFLWPHLFVGVELH